jgi:hypothetical protein
MNQEFNRETTLTRESHTFRTYRNQWEVKFERERLQRQTYYWMLKKHWSEHGKCLLCHQDFNKTNEYNFQKHVLKLYSCKKRSAQCEICNLSVLESYMLDHLDIMHAPQLLVKTIDKLLKSTAKFEAGEYRTCEYCTESMLKTNYSAHVKSQHPSVCRNSEKAYSKTSLIHHFSQNEKILERIKQGRLGLRKGRTQLITHRRKMHELLIKDWTETKEANPLTFDQEILKTPEKPNANLKDQSTASTTKRLRNNNLFVQSIKKSRKSFKEKKAQDPEAEISRFSPPTENKFKTPSPKKPYSNFPTPSLLDNPKLPPTPEKTPTREEIVFFNSELQCCEILNLTPRRSARIAEQTAEEKEESWENFENN